MLMAAGGGSLLAADDANSPSVEERKAVSVLAEKGAVIFIDGDFQVTQVMGGRELSGAAKVFGKLKSFNRKPQACALGMDGSLSAVSANTHASGLRLNDLAARQGKLPHPAAGSVLAGLQRGVEHHARPCKG